MVMGSGFVLFFISCGCWIIFFLLKLLDYGSNIFLIVLER